MRKKKILDFTLRSVESLKQRTEKIKEANKTILDILAKPNSKPINRNFLN